MKLLVTGGSGLLGANLAHLAAPRHDVHIAYRHHPIAVAGATALPLDITDADGVRAAIARIRPVVVVHTAAITDPDTCQRQPEAAWRVNVDGTANVAAACVAVGAHLIYISTDLVFDGAKGRYVEADAPNPLSHYAATKLEGERAATQSGASCAVARCALIYGWSPAGDRSASEWVLRGLRDGRTLSLFTDQYRSPALADNLAAALLEIAERHLEGTFHLGGSDRLSRYEFGCRLAVAFGLDAAALRAVSMDDVPGAAPRPRDCSFDIGKAQRTLRAPLLGVADGLRRLRESEQQGYPATLAEGAAPR